jgi:hypothetical protein
VGVTLPGGIATAPQNLPNIHLILIWPEIRLLANILSRMLGPSAHPGTVDPIYRAGGVVAGADRMAAFVCHECRFAAAAPIAFGSTGGRRLGSNGRRSTLCATPSTISSAIASPVAGALRIPQTLCPVAM